MNLQVRGVPGKIPFAVTAMLPLPPTSAITVRILRDPEDVAYCLSKGKHRSAEYVETVRRVLGDVRTDLSIGTDPLTTIEDLSILGILGAAGNLFAAGTGCHRRDGRWLVDIILARVQSLELHEAGETQGRQ